MSLKLKTDQIIKASIWLVFGTMALSTFFDFDNWLDRLMGLQIWPDRATASSCCVLDLQKLTRLFSVPALQRSTGQSPVSDDPADDGRNKSIISRLPFTEAFDKHHLKKTILM